MPNQAPMLLRHHRPFLAFWFARIFTASGFQMLSVAIGWNIYQLTGNVLDLGLVGLVQFIPRVIFMLHTGHVADRYDRRMVAAICQAGQALIALALFIGSSTSTITPEMIFILSFLLGAARSFEMPTTQALLPPSCLTSYFQGPLRRRSRPSNRPPLSRQLWAVFCMHSAVLGSTARRWSSILLPAG